MSAERDEVGIVLSGSTTREVACQLFYEAEKGGIHEGMLLLVEASPKKRKVLARVGEIIPYNDFYIEGDPWSEARRKKLPVPEDVARQYEICKLDLLIEIPGAQEITVPPHPGDYVCRIDPTRHQKDIFNFVYGDEGIIWYGTQAGYERVRVPVALNVERIPMHIGVFGVTGSGKSYDMGALIEKLVDIPLRLDRKLSFPLLIIDAHGDYAEYAEYQEQLGAATSIVRYVFPDARSLLADKTKGKIQPIGISLDNLCERNTRDLAEMIVQYYRGGAGELSELQIHGIERNLQDLKDGGWQLNSLFTNSFDVLEDAINHAPTEEIDYRSKPAIIRALRKFRDDVEGKKLLSQKSPLKEKRTVDELTRFGSIAIVDFSAEAAPGVDLPMKQLVMTYLATLLFDEFTQYRINNQDRYLLFVIEEAQNFCPDPTYPIATSLAKTKLSAIATQGRKFGLSLCLISQRPSFVDRIVLSMCNTFFIHRISPEDVSFVRSVTGGLPPTLLPRLTKLTQGEMIVTGQMATVPFPLVISVPEEERKVAHRAGKTEVVKNLAKARGLPV